MKGSQIVNVSPMEYLSPRPMAPKTTTSIGFKESQYEPSVALDRPVLHGWIDTRDDARRRRASHATRRRRRRRRERCERCERCVARTRVIVGERAKRRGETRIIATGDGSIGVSTAR